MSESAAPLVNTSPAPSSSTSPAAGARSGKLTVVIGRKHCGKTTLARQLIAGSRRRILIDPLREFREGVIVEDYRALVAYLERQRHAPFYSVILRTLEPREELAAIGLTVHGDPNAALLPGVTLLIDEADRLCNPSSLPPELFRLANYGRHFQVSAILIARRPKRIHHDLTSQADHIYIGPTFEPADVDYLEEYIGAELARKAKAIRQVGEFVHFDASSRGELEAPG